MSDIAPTTDASTNPSADIHSAPGTDTPTAQPGAEHLGQIGRAHV